MLNYYLYFIVAFNSTVSLSRGPRYVTLYSVTCAYSSAAEAGSQSLECEEVEFEFSERASKREKPFTIHYLV